MSPIQFTETDEAEAEAERLVAFPKGSRNHALAALPITCRVVPYRRLIMLPDLGEGLIVVMPMEYNTRESTGDGPIRFDGYWDCVVVQSDSEAYPVGGYDITVDDAEIRRGRLIEPAFTR